jgi:hypothetical protein
MDVEYRKAKAIAIISRCYNKRMNFFEGMLVKLANESEDFCTEENLILAFPESKKEIIKAFDIVKDEVCPAFTFSKGSYSFERFLSGRMNPDVAEHFFKCGDAIDMAKCILRYHSIRAFGMQLAVPQKIVHKLGLDFEAFASPFNTVLENKPFCSLFPDLDGIYGSMGSFFDQTDLSNKRVLANPPFQLDMLDKATNHLLKLLETSTNFFVLYVVAYSWDSDYHIKVRKSKFFRERVDLDKMKHWYWARFHLEKKGCGLVRLGIRSTYFVLTDQEDPEKIKPMLESEFDQGAIVELE